MAANYAEISRVGKLELDFLSFLCSNFLKFSQYYCEMSIIKNQQRTVGSSVSLLGAHAILLVLLCAGSNGFE